MPPASSWSANDPIADIRQASHKRSMTAIDTNLLGQLPLTSIAKVTFYKRDEITSDLICCEVAVAGAVSTFNEEQVGWDLLLQHLYELPNFRTDWYAAVSLPPFETSELVAFSRP